MHVEIAFAEQPLANLLDRTAFGRDLERPFNDMHVVHNGVLLATGVEGTNLC